VNAKRIVRCAHCGTPVERTEAWHAKHVGNVYCSGRCESQQRQEDREGDAMQRRAEQVLAALGDRIIVCSAEGPVGRLGVHCYCTLPRGHDGEHVARAIDGEIVGRWKNADERVAL
jgi:hypothetical protein